MLKFKRETSRTSAIKWLITEHTATDYNAAWPIRFLKGSRPGKRPQLLNVQTNDDKRQLYEKEKHQERSFQPKSKEM
jgi:hypothetical protein